MSSPRLCLLVLSLFVAGQAVYADPCGMVPPVFLTGVTPIERGAVGNEHRYGSRVAHTHLRNGAGFADLLDLDRPLLGGLLEGQVVQARWLGVQRHNRQAVVLDGGAQFDLSKSFV